MTYRERVKIYKKLLALGCNMCKKEKIIFKVSIDYKIMEKKILHQITYDSSDVNIMYTFGLDIIAINNGLKCLKERMPMNELHMDRLEKLYKEYSK